MEYYNNDRTHQGKMRCGRTPMKTLLDGKSIWAEKNPAQTTAVPLISERYCVLDDDQ